MTSDSAIRSRRFRGPCEPQKPNQLACHPSAVTGLESREIQPDDAKNGEGFIAQLNQRFRIIAEAGADPRQWFLQRRSGQSWSTMSFCATRDGLLLAIRDKCIPPERFKQRHDYPDLDALAIDTIRALPPRFHRRTTA